jgi:hypothetical protein
MFWSLKIDALAMLTTFADRDADEFVIAIDAAPLDALLAFWRAPCVAPEKIRWALPPVTRDVSPAGN